jgi:hypothetical protein
MTDDHNVVVAPNFFSIFRLKERAGADLTLIDPLYRAISSWVAGIRKGDINKGLQTIHDSACTVVPVPPCSQLLMAPSGKRIRRQTGDFSPLSHSQSSVTKQNKTRSALEVDAWTSWKYPPTFWDRLSSLHLTRRALEELSRRTGAAQYTAKTVAIPRDLARFVRHGGPDLCDLRGVGTR